MEKIAVENLTFTYPGSLKPALDSVSLKIKTGEFFVLFGNSGCGKTTLLKCLKGALAPRGEMTGEIFLDGKRLSDISERTQSEKIGFVMQNSESAAVTDKVWHELAFGLESLGQDSERIRLKVAETASFFGLEDMYDRSINTLSGGEKKLLSLASVMVMQPDILILDEPLSMLDPIAASEFIGVVDRINKEIGTTVIMSEHSLTEVFPVADRAAFMDNGKIVFSGDVRQTVKAVSEKEGKHALSIPMPSRIYAASGGEGEPPITLREGKSWLKTRDTDEGKVPKDKERANTCEVIRLSDVWFRYEKNGEDVLASLSLSVRQGEIYALVGGNGAGKSTALEVIKGVLSPYRGRVYVSEKARTALIVQNPKDMFGEKTLLEDFEKCFEGKEITEEERENKIRAAAKISSVSSLILRHPFDLSGGEQQRAAVCKALLTEPDIILADEPTKGLDEYNKRKLLRLFKSLKKRGVTIVLVTHDLDFAAECSDRCALLFRGSIVSSDAPKRFFSGNRYYTTKAGRMAEGTVPLAVTERDILMSLGVKEENDDTRFDDNTEAEDIVFPKKEKKKANYMLFALFALAAVLFMYFKPPIRYSDVFKVFSVIFAAAALYFLFPGAGGRVPYTVRKLSPQAVLILLLSAAAAALTVFFGNKLSGGRKYYFLSLAVMLETLLPLLILFEKKRKKAALLVTVSMLSALGVAGRAAFSPIMQFKPVTAIVIVSALCLGGEAGFAVGAMTAFLSNFIFGQGPWTPWQMFAFGFIGLITGIISPVKILKNRAVLSVYGFLTVMLFYGPVMNLYSALMSQDVLTLGAVITYLSMGLPMDLIHGAATAFFLFFTAKPLTESLERLKIKYSGEL